LAAPEPVDSAPVRAELEERAAPPVVNDPAPPPAHEESARDVAALVAGEIGARVVTVDPQDADWPATLRAVAGCFDESYPL